MTQYLQLQNSKHISNLLVLAKVIHEWTILTNDPTD